MTRYRLRIQKFSLLIRSTLHPTIIPNNRDQPTDRHAELFRTLLGDQRIRRVYGSTEQAITYARALRTGQLPADIEPAAWQRWLDVSRQSVRSTPVTVTLFAALALLNSVYHLWALVALLAVAAVWSLGYGLVLRRRILRLATAIDQRESAPG
jgi:C4-dicarboxylate-specific signal transduction histidine kinase